MKRKLEPISAKAYLLQGLIMPLVMHKKRKSFLMNIAKRPAHEFTIKDKPVDPLFPGAKAALEELAASGLVDWDRYK